MGIKKIILNKNSGKKVKYCQLTQELLKIIDIRDTEVELEIDDRVSDETIGDLTNVYTSILNTHNAVFENSVIVKMCEFYGCLFETEIVAVGTNDGLRSLLQSVNISLNQLELNTNFTNKFLNICQGANICEPKSILAINLNFNYFVVNGNCISTLAICPQLLIEGCSAMGWYTIKNLDYDGTNTLIYVNEAIPSDENLGTIRCPVISNISKNNILEILREKGLDI